MALYCLCLDFTSVEAYSGRFNLLCPDNLKVTLQLAHGIYIWKSVIGQHSDLCGSFLHYIVVNLEDFCILAS